MVRTVWRERQQYQVAHVAVFSGPAFLWAEAACATLRAANRPYVLTLHGGNLPVFSRRWPGRVRRLLHSAAAVTTPSRYLLERMAAFRADLRLVPNGIDTCVFGFRLRERPRPALVWLRAFHRIYNPALAPSVLAALVPEVPDACLTMIGPDRGDGSLCQAETHAAKLGVAGRVTFLGAVPWHQVATRLNQSDVFLNTTSVDNTPLSVLEAMACGLCVVSTNVGGMPALIEDGRSGLLVPPNDVEAMAGAVRRIYREPDLAAALSRQARARAEQFDWTVVLPQWFSLLDTVVPPRAA
jgi:glycosyltransferase involved in cell wall biosynthesis